jgi:hypothetical protein
MGASLVLLMSIYINWNARFDSGNSISYQVLLINVYSRYLVYIWSIEYQLMKSRFSSNVVIIGRPLVNNSWKDKQDVALEKINQFWNSPDKGTSDKEQIQEYSREPYYD